MAASLVIKDGALLLKGGALALSSLCCCTDDLPNDTPDGNPPPPYTTGECCEDTCIEDCDDGQRTFLDLYIRGSTLDTGCREAGAVGGPTVLKITVPGALPNLHYPRLVRSGCRWLERWDPTPFVMTVYNDDGCLGDSEDFDGPIDATVIFDDSTPPGVLVAVEVLFAGQFLWMGRTTIFPPDDDCLIISVPFDDTGHGDHPVFSSGGTALIRFCNPLDPGCTP